MGFLDAPTTSTESGSYAGSFDPMTGVYTPAYSVGEHGSVVNVENGGFSTLGTTENEVLSNKLMEGVIDSNATNQKILDSNLSKIENPSWMQSASPYMQGFANLAGGAASIAGIYTGFKQLGLMEDQVDIAKEQWSETKTELARVKKVRNDLNASYA